MSDSYNTRIKLKRDTEANWTSLDPVLLDGEVAIVRMPDGNTRKKIGDGAKKFSELPYDGGDFVQYAAQALTDEQKKQARENIDSASDFVINVTASGDPVSYSTDKTFSQIKEAILDGKRAFLRMSEGTNGAIIFPFVELTGNVVTFGVTSIDGQFDALSSLKFKVNSSDAVVLVNAVAPCLNSDRKMPQISMASAPTSNSEIATKKYVDDNKTTVPTALKNPNALTIKIGSTTVTYDGSTAKTVEIADGSEVSY